MPYQTSPEIDFSAIGLVTDVPANAVPTGGWSNSLDVRCRNGSVQGVNAFEDDIVLHDTDENIYNGRAKAVTQFTPAGGSDLIIAYIVEGADGYGHVVIYNTGTSDWDDITNATANQKFTFDDSHPPQIFVFNELLIVNPGTDAPPQYTTATVGAGSLVELPNWLYDVEGNNIDGITSAKFYTITALGDTTQAQWEAAGLSSSVTAAVGVVFTAGSSMTIAGTGTVKLSNPIIARVVKPFNNRLVAMNIKEERGSSADVYLPIDFLWSSHITGIASLTAATWTSSVTNTAGDAFLVDTPGRILDGGQLGEFFIAYKADSVIRVRETGDSFVLAFESIFEDDGIYSTRCFSNIGNSQHLVIGNYSVYVHDGQSQKQDIAKDLFKDTMYALVRTGGCTETSYSDLTTKDVSNTGDDRVRIASDPFNSGRFLLSWGVDTSNNGSSNDWFVQIMNVSEYTATLGPVFELDYHGGFMSQPMFDPVFVNQIVFLDRPTNISMRYLSISGDTISLGSSSVSSNGALPLNSCTLHFLKDGEFCATWGDSSGGNSYVKVQGGKRDSAGAITWENSLSLGSSTDNARDSSSDSIKNTNKVILAFEQSSNLKTAILTVSNGTVSIGTQYTHSIDSVDTTIDGANRIVTTTNNRFIVPIQTGTLGVNMDLVTGTVLGSVVTYSNFYTDITSQDVSSNQGVDEPRLRFYKDSPDKFDLIYETTTSELRTIRGSITPFAAAELYEISGTHPYEGDKVDFQYLDGPGSEAITSYWDATTDNDTVYLSLSKTTVDKTEISCETGALASSERDRSFCFHQTRDKEVWFCFTSNDYEGLGCDAAFVYNYEDQKLHRRSLPGLSDIFETELDGVLKIYAAKSNDTKLQVLSNSVLVSDGFFERTDDNLTDNSKVKCINRIHVNAKGTCLIALTGTQNLSDSKSYTNSTFNPASNYKIDTRTSGRYMNLKVTMNGATNPELSKLQFDVKMMGVR